MSAVSRPPVVAKPLPHPALWDQPGLLRRIFRHPQPVLDELTGSLGPIYALGAGPVRMAIVGDPAALRELFAMSTDSFKWNHKFNVLGFVVGQGSMIVSDGTDHKRRRSAVQSAFSRRRLNGWIPMIVDRTDAVIDDVVQSLGGASKRLDLYPEGRGLVLEIAIRSFFGEGLARRSTEIGELFQGPQDYLESPFIRQLPHPFPRTARSRVRADRKALDAIIDEEMRQLRTSPVDDPLDVLACLVNESVLEDHEIRDQVVTLMGAGFDTTSASLAWILWRVSLTPGLWQRLRAEADEVLGPVDGPSAADDRTFAALGLANRTMRETVRLHPAGAVGPREAAVDLVVGGYRIPKGTLVLWSAHLAGRDDRAWPDPLRFDPDRFVDASPEQRTLSEMAWVPFGKGARNCIGFALAQMELTLILARLAQRLDISTDASEPPQPVGMVVNRPLGGAPMTVSERQQPNSSASSET
jgi:cytochrome P450